MPLIPSFRRRQRQVDQFKASLVHSSRTKTKQKEKILNLRMVLLFKKKFYLYYILTTVFSPLLLSALLPNPPHPPPPPKSYLLLLHFFQKRAGLNGYHPTMAYEGAVSLGTSYLG
jgi:hypothetical protein